MQYLGERDIRLFRCIPCCNTSLLNFNTSAGVKGSSINLMFLVDSSNSVDESLYSSIRRLIVSILPSFERDESVRTSVLVYGDKTSYISDSSTENIILQFYRTNKINGVRNLNEALRESLRCFSKDRHFKTGSKNMIVMFIGNKNRILKDRLDADVLSKLKYRNIKTKLVTVDYEENENLKPLASIKKDMVVINTEKDLPRYFGEIENLFQFEGSFHFSLSFFYSDKNGHKCNCMYPYTYHCEEQEIF